MSGTASRRPRRAGAPGRRAAGSPGRRGRSRASGALVGEVGTVGRGHAATRVAKSLVERRDARRRRRRGWPARPAPARRAQSSGPVASRIVSASAAASPAGTCSPSTPSLDQLGHAADAGADHRAARGARLVDDERRVLPPDRRHDDPVGPAHQPDDVGAVVGSEVLRRPAPACFSPAAKASRKLASAQPSPPCSATRSSPRPAGARRRRAAPARPCAARSLPKIGEAVPAGPRRLAAAGLGIAGDGVRHHIDAVGIEAPGDEPVAQEGARRDEAVDAGEQRRAGARAAARGAPPRAPESSAGRRRAARRDSGRPRRSSAGGRRSGRSAGSRAASARSGRRGASRRIAGTISAPIRSSPCRCTTSGRRVSSTRPSAVDPGVAVEPRHREAVVGPGVEHDVVAVGAEAAGFAPWPLQRRGCHQQPAAAVRAGVERPGEVVRDDLRAARRPVGMVVRDLEDAEPAHGRSSWPEGLKERFRTSCNASESTHSARRSGRASP